MSGTTLPSKASNISGRELVWLAGAIVFGAMLRLEFPGRMAVEHFDEGVYASNIWFGAEMGYEYPARHLYAPPLLPAAIEWTLIVASLLGIKPTGWVPMIPCLIAGIATIPSIWWIGRKWFGPSGGLAAAWLVATSDLHASYSRAALTDVPVALFILWAVYFFWRALAERDLGHSSNDRGRANKPFSRCPNLHWQDCMLAGVFTGLAWWTKYNGWLPLAIGLAGGIFWNLLVPTSQRQIRRVITTWLLVAFVAGGFFSFVLWNLQEQNRGGYASVAANHRQYLVGLVGWLDSATTQIRHVGIYENLFAWIVELAGKPSESAIVGILFTLTLQILAGAAILWGLARLEVGPEHLAVCLLTAWYCGMTVSTPFYYPYPRLVFPWLMSIWLSLGLGIELLHRKFPSSDLDQQLASNRQWNPSRVFACIVGLLVLNSGIRSMIRTDHARQDRTSLANIAQKIADVIRQQNSIQGTVVDKAIVYVWGEPAVVFSLRATGVSNVMPITNLGFVGDRQPVPVYFAFGEQAHSSPSFSEQQQALDRCQLVETFPVRPSHLVVYDSKKAEVSGASEEALPRIWLYRAP